MGGLIRSHFSWVHVCRLPQQRGGLKVSHSTAHPATGGPGLLSGGRPCRQAQRQLKKSNEGSFVRAHLTGY